MSMSGTLMRDIHTYMFEPSNRGYGSPGYPKTVNHLDNPVFNKFLEVTVCPNKECFIPLMGLKDICYLIKRKMFEEGQEESLTFTCPLYIGRSDVKKTADSILKVLNRMTTKWRLIHIETTKGTDYYGGAGVVFNDSWNPLMIHGFTVKIDTSISKIELITPVCYVSPKVFMSKDILSKAIVSKVIPYISSSNLLISRLFNDTDVFKLSYRSYHPNSLIVVKNIDEYFVTPEAPATNSISNPIWDMLNDSIDIV